MRNKIFVVLVVLLSIPSIWSLFRPGYFPMHDDMQAMRVHQMDKCIRDFQIPCRWVPDMGYGYGYPQFNFYSPLPYYTMETFHLLGLSILDSVKIGFILTIFIAGIGMYLLGKELWGKWGGVVSALFFVYAPYRAVDMYVRGAVGEFWALSILPFIFWSILAIYKKYKFSYLYFTLSLSALFLSHNVTTVITLPFLSLFILFLEFKEYLRHKKLKNSFISLIRVFFASLWGFGMAAFFLLPAFFEKQYVHVETLVGGYFDYRIHFVSFRQLFFDNFWGYGGSEFGQFDEIFLGVGIIHWLVSLIALIVILLKNNRDKLTSYLFFLFVGISALFMAHSKSAFIWRNISFLEILQFPWRFLVLAAFSFSLLAGSIMTFTRDKKLFIVLFIFLMLFYGTFFRPKSWINITDQEKFSGENWRLAQTISIFDYLPKSAEFPPAERAPDNPQVISGDTDFTFVEKRSNWYRFEAETFENSIIEIPIIYFPGWQVYADGEKIDFAYDNELGLLTIQLQEGNHQVVARFDDTPVRKIGNYLTLLSFLGIVFYIYRLRKN